MKAKINNEKKISIIGAGYVGSTIAYSLMMRGLANEIVLIDINKDASECEALDIRHGIPYMGVCNIHQGDYDQIYDSDLIIITAGKNRKPGQSRLDLAEENTAIIKSVCEQIKKYYNCGVILVVTNPVDIITAKVTDFLGLPKGMVFGTGCILDSSRLTNVLADYLGISADVVNAQIIGEHGSSQITLWSKVTIAGLPIKNYCDYVEIPFDDSVKNRIDSEVIGMGSKIIRGKGKTHYGIATCVCYIADAIINKRATIASVTSVLNGEYGINGVALSLPSVITSTGIERVLADYLDADEYKKIKNSFHILDDALKTLKDNGQ